MADINIRVEGIQAIEAGLTFLKVNLQKYLQAAGVEAAKQDVLKTEGLQKYPPATSANRPPVPYYIRGRGTQYKNGNNGKSEKLGSNWHVDKVPYGAQASNKVSYAKFVNGDDQAKAMEKIGWRKITEVAEEKVKAIEKRFYTWISKALLDAKLK